VNIAGFWGFNGCGLISLRLAYVAPTMAAVTGR
jgi:hypothetical protein